MFGKVPTSSTRKPQIIGCIITHNSEAQINATERDRATRGSQKIKKQKTVTPTIKGNATAVRSRNTKYYILHHDLSPNPRHPCNSANIKRAIRAVMIISPAKPMVRYKLLSKCKTAQAAP